ncbi:MAG TPA: FAD-dependent oxidoreductase [Chitinophagales bacterium]|nr:FAD-dependent oxidoreductase [Chitinophagales bacterium]
MKKNISIAGCGVIGLTTAIRLQEEGYEVQIITRDLPQHTTSNKAAAFWFPYHVRDSERILDWSMYSYHKFESLAAKDNCGVHMIPVIKLGNEVNEIEQRIKDTLPAERFRPLHTEELRGGFDSGWCIQVPLIETPVYLPYLLNTFIEAGGKIIQRSIQSLDELLQEETLLINCTGLGSRELAQDDQVIPIRGQIALLKTENRHRIVLEDLAPTYIVYRSDGCICGGTYEVNCADVQPEEKTLQQILERCIHLEPELQSATVIDSWAGLRPFRADIRVETETGKPLIHNYGHGGSGFTVSWGCAEEVVKLLQKF